MANATLRGVILRSFVLALLLIVVALSVLSVLTYDGTCPVLGAGDADCAFGSYFSLALAEYAAKFFTLRGALVTALFLVLFWPVSFGLLVILSPVELRGRLRARGS
jgi:hypothetical protein